MQIKSPRTVRILRWGTVSVFVLLMLSAALCIVDDHLKSNQNFIDNPSTPPEGFRPILLFNSTEGSTQEPIEAQSIEGQNLSVDFWSFNVSPPSNEIWATIFKEMFLLLGVYAVLRFIGWFLDRLITFH
jgi:hypothetical protein